MELNWYWLIAFVVVSGIAAAITDAGHAIVMGILRIRDSAADTVVGAASSGRIDRLRELLTSATQDVNAVDIDGRNALHHAVYRRDSAMVKLLIDAGCAIDTVYLNAPWQQRRTPLLEAIMRPSIDLALLLLDRGASPYGDPQCMAIHSAAYQVQHEVVDRLLALGVPVDQPNTQGETPLYCACGAQFVADSRLEKDFAERQTRTVKALVKGGANVQYVDRSGKSCVDRAPAAIAAYLLERRTATSSGFADSSVPQA